MFNNVKVSFFGTKSKYCYVSFKKFIMSKPDSHSKKFNNSKAAAKPKSKSTESLFANFTMWSSSNSGRFNPPLPSNYSLYGLYWQSVLQQNQLCDPFNTFLPQHQQISKLTSNAQHQIYHSSRVINRQCKDTRRNRSAGGKPRNCLNELTKVCELLCKRIWEPIYDDKGRNGDFTFTVMSYNVLAQDLIKEHPELYRMHDPNALRWNVRWRNLYNEIKVLSPDIMCLQEVQNSHIGAYYDKLEALGYIGIYKKRTGCRVDGCAIFYKAHLFALEEYETVEFFQPNVPILNRDNVGIIATFSPKRHPHKSFVIATTHLLYNPKREDVRLAQMQLLLTEVERLSFRYKFKLKNPYLPIILTGDLNSTPDSEVYSFLTKDSLNYEHLSNRSVIEASSNKQKKFLVPPHLGITDDSQHFLLLEQRKTNRQISRSLEKALIQLHNSERDVSVVSSENLTKNFELFGSGSIKHKFSLKSVYAYNTENPEGTTFQNRWLMVDYIFYSWPHLATRHMDALTMLTVQELMKQLRKKFLRRLRYIEILLNFQSEVQ
ncbi:protein angel homolog 2-like isoform X2 [Cylas formicarius]|uniref:protein angel homolog 2-like isoform X2 n=1 Tax=Cylas formicarius TaxID=197179 RepID=UPI002958551C|nr:protein angel homolog 2-like isoform X2 [Cylas formicarius]